MSFSFAHISDSHLLHREDELRMGFSPAHSFRKVLQFIGEELVNEIDFVICGGDLVETPDAESYALGAKLMGLRKGAAAPGPGTIHREGIDGLPIYFLPGNHDDRENYYRGLFSAPDAQGLMNALFVHKGIRFICLDLSPAVKGEMSNATFDFLRENLNDDPTIILTHHPLVTVGARWLDKYLADNLDRFWELLSSKKILGTFSGHVHISYEQLVNGIPIVGTRSTAFAFVPQDEKIIALWPPHIRVVKVDGSGLSTRVVEVPLD